MEVFWILGYVFSFWDVFWFWELFWILGHVLDSGNCVVLLEAQKSAQISATDHLKKLQLHQAVDDHNNIKIIFTNFAKYIHP